MPTRTRRNSHDVPSPGVGVGGVVLPVTVPVSSPHPPPQSPASRQHQQRSRIALFFSHQQRKNLALFLSGCLLYGYAFFYWQPDRSFAEIQRVNLEAKAREQLRLEHRKAQRNGQDLDSVPEISDEAPDWQRKMRARAGDMAWKREQEQLAAAGHSNLRGGGNNGYGDDYYYEDEEEEEDGNGNNNNNNKRQRRRRRRPKGSVGQAILDFIVMMSVFVITRTILRVCLLYRQLMRAQGGLAAAGLSLPPVNGGTGTTTTTRTRRTSSRGTNTTNTTRNNSGRGALARLVVPQSMHAHMTLLRTARFRSWVTQLNRQRQENGQPPLSLESLRLVMRDSDFDGNDYEALMRFHEEATLAQSMGASQAEIDRCPARVLTDPNDELLCPTINGSTNSNNNNLHECPICLEPYQLGDRVRRIHCMHEYHASCIDPWLAHKALCPVCKHPVVG